MKQESGSAIGIDSHTATANLPTKILGVKSYGVNTAGLGMVSSGHKQLDELLGGGLTLGSVLLIETDTYSNHGEILMAYNLAESISCRQNTLLITPEFDNLEKISSTLPYNQSLRNIGDVDAAVNASKAENRNKAKEDSASELHSKDAKDRLVIAWQYEKYIIADATSNKEKGSSINSSQYCSSYDISRRMQDSVLSSGLVTKLSIDSFPPDKTADGNFCLIFDTLMERICSYIRAIEGSSVPNATRIFLPNLSEVFDTFRNEQCESNISKSEEKLIIAKFLLRVKQLIRSTRVVVICTLQSSTTSPHILNKLAQVADTVVSVESFAGRAQSIPYEFDEFCGFFMVHKVQQHGVLAPHRSNGSRFGIKRDRRKLHIEPLHLPPEDNRAMQSSNKVGGSTANNSTAAAASVADFVGARTVGDGCSSTPSIASDSSVVNGAGDGGEFNAVRIHSKPSSFHKSSLIPSPSISPSASASVSSLSPSSSSTSSISIATACMSPTNAVNISISGKAPSANPFAPISISAPVSAPLGSGGKEVPTVTPLAAKLAAARAARQAQTTAQTSNSTDF